MKETGYKRAEQEKKKKCAYVHYAHLLLRQTDRTEKYRKRNIPHENELPEKLTFIYRARRYLCQKPNAKEACLYDDDGKRSAAAENAFGGGACIHKQEVIVNKCLQRTRRLWVI